MICHVNSLFVHRSGHQLVVMDMPRTDSTQAMQTLIGAYADDDVSDDDDNNDVHNISGSDDETAQPATVTQSVTTEQKSNSETGTPPVKKSRLEQRKGIYNFLMYISYAREV